MSQIKYESRLIALEGTDLNIIVGGCQLETVHHNNPSDVRALSNGSGREVPDRHSAGVGFIGNCDVRYSSN